MAQGKRGCVNSETAGDHGPPASASAAYGAYVWVANNHCLVDTLLYYVAQLLVSATLTSVGCVLKNIIENLGNCVPRCELPQGSLKLSFVIVLLVGAQLFVTVSISRVIIFLLLMTSGDVERNPGPEQSLTGGFNSFCIHVSQFW